MLNVRWYIHDLQNLISVEGSCSPEDENLHMDYRSRESGHPFGSNNSSLESTGSKWEGHLWRHSRTFGCWTWQPLDWNMSACESIVGWQIFGISTAVIWIQGALFVLLWTHMTTAAVLKWLPTEFGIQRKVVIWISDLKGTDLPPQPQDAWYVFAGQFSEFLDIEMINMMDDGWY